MERVHVGASSAGPPRVHGPNTLTGVNRSGPRYRAIVDDCTLVVIKDLCISTIIEALTAFLWVERPDLSITTESQKAID